MRIYGYNLNNIWSDELRPEKFVGKRTTNILYSIPPVQAKQVFLDSFVDKVLHFPLHFILQMEQVLFQAKHFVNPSLGPDLALKSFSHPCIPFSAGVFYMEALEFIRLPYKNLGTKTMTEPYQQSGFSWSCHQLLGSFLK